MFGAKNFSLQTADGKLAKIDSFLARLGLLVFGVPHLGMRLRARNIFALLGPAKQDVVLDAGCGIGLYCFALASKGCSVFGLDSDARKINEARGIAGQISSNAVFLNANVLHIPFKNNFFDKVVCSDVIEHVERDAAALAEIARVLKHGGLLVLTVPNLTKETLARKDGFGHAHTGYTVEDVGALCDGAGLVLKKIVPYQCFFGSIAWHLNEKSFRFPVLAAVLFYPLYFFSFFDLLLPNQFKRAYGWIALLQKPAAGRQNI